MMPRPLRTACALAVLALGLSSCNGRTSTTLSGGQGVQGPGGGAATGGAGTVSSAGGAGGGAATGGAVTARGGSSTAADANVVVQGPPVCDTLSSGYGSPPYPGSQTQVSDGCNTCNCVKGAWVCTTKVCSGYPACPTEPPLTPPSLNAPHCPGENQICSGWGSCSPVCQCTGGTWLCMWPSCFCPPAPVLPKVYTEPDGQVVQDGDSLNCDKPNLFCQTRWLDEPPGNVADTVAARLKIVGAEPHTGA